MALKPDVPIIDLIRPAAWGDVMMLTAVLPGLKAQGYRIRAFVCEPFVLLLQEHPLVDACYVLPYSRLGSPWRHQQLKRLARQLAAVDGMPHRQVICQHPASQVAVQTLASRMRWPWLARQSAPLHTIEAFCQQVGVPVSWSLQVPLSQSDRDWAAPYGQAILIQPFSSQPAKDWPVSHWQALIKRLKTVTHSPIYQLSQYDQPILDGVERLPNDTMHQALAAVAGCKLFLGADSAFNHACAAFNRQAVILWGPTQPKRFGYDNLINFYDNQRVTPSEHWLWQPKPVAQTTLETVWQVVEPLVAEGT